jgi:hypothetical protein
MSRMRAPRPGWSRILRNYLRLRRTREDEGRPERRPDQEERKGESDAEADGERGGGKSKPCASPAALQEPQSGHNVEDAHANERPAEGHERVLPELLEWTAQ